MTQPGALDALSAQLESSYLDLQDSVASLVESVNMFDADFSERLSQIEGASQGELGGQDQSGATV